MLEIFLVQGIGAIAYSILSLSYYKKEKQQILYMQIIAYMLFSIHYYLLSGVTGAICNVIGLMALLVIYLFEKYNLKNKKSIVFVLIGLLLMVNIISFQNIFSIFPIIASVIVLFSFLENNENDIRWMGFISAICWLFYAIVYKSYISIAFEVVTLTSVVISILKNKKGGKNE